MPLRVLLADASMSFIDAVESSLEQVPGVDVSIVGRAGTAARTVELALTKAPDIAFISLNLDDGASAARTILRVMSDPPKIILLRDDEADDAEFEAHAARAPGHGALRGVSGYAAKSDAAESLRLLIALEALTRPSTAPESAG